MLLEQINQVNDIKKLNKEDWEPLAQEIRGFSDRENQCDRRPFGFESGRGGADHGHASGI